MHICGIDPGKTGGIVLIDQNGNLVEKSVIPTIGKEIDYTDLKDLLEHYNSIDEHLHAFIERVNAFRAASRTSSFEFGRVFGGLEASLRIMDIPTTYVSPKQWTKEIHKGIMNKLKAKEKSKLAYRRLFPSVNLKKSDQCKQPHEGLIDALLIAEYGRRFLLREAK